MMSHEVQLITHDSSLITGFFGAKGGTRTRTALGHWILSPARLPIPPLSRAGGCRQSSAVVGGGAPARTRTWNQWIKSPLLYQLSYGGSDPAQRNGCENYFGSRARVKPSYSSRSPCRK